MRAVRLRDGGLWLRVGRLGLYGRRWAGGVMIQWRWLDA